MSIDQITIDQIAEEYVEAEFQLDPVSATVQGVAGLDDRWSDFSPAGAAAHAELAAATLRTLEAAVAASPALSENDRVTVAAMRERLGLLVDLHEADLSYGQVRVIASPAQALREVFDLAPTATAENWRDVATRLATMPEAMAGYLDGVRQAQARGTGPALRQVQAAIDLCGAYGEPDGFFAQFVAQADVDDSLTNDLQRGAATAAESYRSLVETLRAEIAPNARTTDGVGGDAYALWSRVYLGAKVDLEETYQWGLEEVARVEAEMAETAKAITGGTDVDDAVRALDADPKRRLEGTEALRDWMQRTSDEAVAVLGRDHFDIPDQIRTLECMIAPTEEGGIYYTGPSEDFTRPGRMWWSVPPGVTEFTTWQEKTTVYHEGVPGHHLQVGQTMVRAAELNRWRRIGVWVSGHGEGWALYAERLMSELGFLDDPGDRLGMLDAAAFRASRVVVDIGTHCGFEAPAEVGGGVWDAEKMWAFMRAHCRVEDKQLRFECLRYLGWPGQAPSYKVGERLWWQARARAEARQGDAFDLKAFHRRALDLGSVGLDVLLEALS